MEYVIDGYLVVPRISNLNPNDYLDYLVDSDLKGIRTIPQLEKVRGSYRLSFDRDNDKNNGFCLRKKEGKIRTLVLSNESDAVWNSGERTRIDVVTEALEQERFDLKYFTPSRKKKGVPFAVEKLSEDTVWDVIENFGKNELTLYVPGFRENGEYVIRRNYHGELTRTCNFFTVRTKGQSVHVVKQEYVEVVVSGKTKLEEYDTKGTFDRDSFQSLSPPERAAYLNELTEGMFTDFFETKEIELDSSDDPEESEWRITSLINDGKAYYASLYSIDQPEYKQVGDWFFYSWNV
jgi:hypothetical protein